MTGFNEIVHPGNRSTERIRRIALGNQDDQIRERQHALKISHQSFWRFVNGVAIKNV